MANSPELGSILVVDDMEEVRLLVRDMLTARGYNACAAGSGEEALRVLDEAAGGFDLLLTDLVMPGMKGPDLAVQAWRRWPRLRVALMTGQSDASAVRSPLDAPLLRKPFSAERLARFVGMVIASPPGVRS